LCRWGFVVLWAPVTWLPAAASIFRGQMVRNFSQICRNPMFVAAFVRMWQWTVCCVTNRIPTSSYWARSQNCEKRLLVSSCLPVRLSVRVEQLGSQWTDSNEIWYFTIFWNIYLETSSFITIWQEWQVICTKTYVYLCLSQFFLEWEMFQREIV